MSARKKLSLGALHGRTMESASTGVTERHSFELRGPKASIFDCLELCRRGAHGCQATMCWCYKVPQCRSEGRHVRRFRVSDSPVSCKRCSALFCDETCLAVHLIRCPRTAKRRWQRLWSDLPAMMERWLLWCAGLLTALMACFNCGRQA